MADNSESSLNLHKTSISNNWKSIVHNYHQRLHLEQPSYNSYKHGPYHSPIWNSEITGKYGKYYSDDCGSKKAAENNAAEKYYKTYLQYNTINDCISDNRLVILFSDSIEISKNFNRVYVLLNNADENKTYILPNNVDVVASANTLIKFIPIENDNQVGMKIMLKISQLININKHNKKYDFVLSFKNDKLLNQCDELIQIFNNLIRDKLYTIKILN